MAVAIYREDAFRLADEHCQKYGKVARVTGNRTTRDGAATAQSIVFDCVARS